MFKRFMSFLDLKFTKIRTVTHHLPNSVINPHLPAPHVIHPRSSENLVFGQLTPSSNLESIDTNLLLHNPTVRPDQMVQGEVQVIGIDKQMINEVLLKLMVAAETGSGDLALKPLILQQWSLAQRFELAAQQELVLPFQLQLPHETPVTEVDCLRNNTRVWLEIQIGTDNSVAIQHRTQLSVSPIPTVQDFLQLLQDSGFMLAYVELEKGQLRDHSHLRGQGFRSVIDCYQEFGVVRAQPRSFDRETALSFVVQAEQTHVMLEQDRSTDFSTLQTFSIRHQGSSAAQMKHLINAYFK